MADSSYTSFQRTLTLFDGEDTRKKATVMDKWDVMTDDERNGNFEGLDEFLEWGKTYKITIEEVRCASAIEDSAC